MDCFSCSDDGCVMKTEKYQGAYPCHACARSRAAVIDETCYFCMSTQKVCCFVEDEAVRIGNGGSQHESL